MFDPNFDPLAELQELKKAQVRLLNNQSQLSKSAAEQLVLNGQMITLLNQQTEAINNIDLHVTDLHNRLQLLEIARQYENTKDNNPAQTKDYN